MLANTRRILSRFPRYCVVETSRVRGRSHLLLWSNVDCHLRLNEAVELQLRAMGRLPSYSPGSALRRTNDGSGNGRADPSTDTCRLPHASISAALRLSVACGLILVCEERFVNTDPPGTRTSGPSRRRSSYRSRPDA